MKIIEHQPASVLDDEDEIAEWEMAAEMLGCSKDNVSVVNSQNDHAAAALVNESGGQKVIEEQTISCGITLRLYEREGIKMVVTSDLIGLFFQTDSLNNVEVIIPDGE